LFLEQHPWWTSVAPGDEEIVSRQLGRKAHGLLAIARRCRYGCPQVIVNSPVMWGPGRRSERKAGIKPDEPRVFPTLFWLSCPCLVKAVSELERQGWVGRLNAWLRESGREAFMKAAHERAAAERIAAARERDGEKLRRYHPAQWQVLAESGIGGMREKAGVKCLHLHLADYLAGPFGAEAGERPVPTVGITPDARHVPGARNILGAQTLALLLAAGVDITGCTGKGRPCCLGKERGAGGAPAGLAVLDVGTNSCRLLQGQVVENELHIRPVVMAVTRLGQGLNKNGRLTEEAIERTLQGLDRLLGTSTLPHLSLPASSPPFSSPTQSPQTLSSPLSEGPLSGAEGRIVAAVGTAALRMAENAASFLIQAWERLKLAVRVISGEEEAALSFAGARRALMAKRQRHPDLFAGDSGRLLVVDIGGGSTEFMAGSWDGTPRWLRSVPLGAVSLMEKAVSRQTNTVAAMREQVRELLASVLVDYRRTVPEEAPLLLAGVGGTWTSLAAIDLALEIYEADKVTGYSLTREQVEALADKLEALPLAERRRLPGLQPERADIITSGAAIVLAVMDTWAPDQAVVCDGDLLLALLHQLFHDYYSFVES